MRSIGIIIIILMILTACTPVHSTIQSGLTWQLSDLRFLETPNTSDPTSDLIAIYTRKFDDDFQFRIDILDLKPDFNINFYILLDTNPAENLGEFQGAPTAFSTSISNQGWDWLLVLPRDGNPQAFYAGNNQLKNELIPRIQRNPVLDSVTISFNLISLPIPENMKFKVLMTTKNGEILLDQSPPINNILSNPILPAPLIIVFNDSFPAFTPAQALRLWDGAHSGPLGKRHGLKHILSNAEKSGIPIVLLDLINPNSLSAIDFIGALPQVHNMVNHNLLLLPELAYAIPDDLSLQFSRDIASAFGLPGSIFAYSTDGKLQMDHHFQFVNLLDRSHLILQEGKILIPLPDLAETNIPIQTSNEGLSLDVRRQLLVTALSPDPADLVILGGSIVHSTWGDSEVSSASMAYIAAHPWIQTLNANQIQAFDSQPFQIKYEPQLPPIPSFHIYTSQGHLIDLDSNQLKAHLLEDLQNSPKNATTDLAWKMFFSLASPISNQLYSQLQFQYLNQVGSILAASHWGENPGTISDCSKDIDYDSLDECVLSNTRFFAVIEKDGGRLSFLFERHGNQIHQLIGPLSQFAVGLSDPSLWHLEHGPAADPAEIPGAFSESDNPFLLYEILQLEDNLLVLNRSDGQIKKTFQLVENGLSIEYNSRPPISMNIPLAIDPQNLSKPDWAKNYYSQRFDDSVLWGLYGSTSIKIRSTGIINTHDFTESSSLIKDPENPDLDYPPGHFLPFPIALIEVSGIGRFSVDIRIQN
ncbi:MAG: hypothetical protein ABIJ65_03885 [Chloroflexota bacterium]